MQVYYPPAEQIPLPAHPGIEIGEMSARWDNYAVQRINGKTPHPEFSHLSQAKLTRLHLWHYFVLGVATIWHKLSAKV